MNFARSFFILASFFFFLLSRQRQTRESDSVVLLWSLDTRQLSRSLAACALDHARASTCA